MIMHVIIHKIISRTVSVNFYVFMWPKSCVTETKRDAQLNQADIPRGSSSCADESLAPRQESGSTAVRDETEVDVKGKFLLIFCCCSHSRVMWVLQGRTSCPQCSNLEPGIRTLIFQYEIWPPTGLMKWPITASLYNNSKLIDVLLPTGISLRFVA